MGGHHHGLRLVSGLARRPRKAAVWAQGPAVCRPRTMPLRLGFLDVSGISLLDNSSATVWPSLPSSAELASPAALASGPDDICPGSDSQERGGEWRAHGAPSGEGCGEGGPQGPCWVRGWTPGGVRPHPGSPFSTSSGGGTWGSAGAGPAGLLSPALCAAGEATWSGSEFEVSFPDSPGAQAQPDHLPQLTLPDSLTAAASPEDGLSAELLEAQAEEEPASALRPDFGAEGPEAEGTAVQAPPPTPK